MRCCQIQLQFYTKLLYQNKHTCRLVFRIRQGNFFQNWIPYHVTQVVCWITPCRLSRCKWKDFGNGNGSDNYDCRTNLYMNFCSLTEMYADFIRGRGPLGQRHEGRYFIQLAEFRGPLLFSTALNPSNLEPLILWPWSHEIKHELSLA